MGARQWVNQTDLHLVAERDTAPNFETVPDTDGGKHDTYRVRLYTPKRRDTGDTGKPEHLQVVSHHNADGALDTAAIEANADGASSADGSERQELAERIGAFVKARVANGEGDTTTAEMAAAIKLAPTNNTFKRAVREAMALRLIERVSKGVYGPV